MATPSPMNRGYASGLAANRAPTTGLAANRAPMTGQAAGAQPGGSFRPNLAPMNYGMARPAAAQSPQPAPMAPAAPMPGTTQPPMATPAPMDFSLPEPPPVDFSNMFGAPPLPAPGQQSFNQPPPNPFGPAPLPFGGFRAEGGPVMPGQAYMVGERGPEMIVPQMPGMVVPNRALTLSPGAQRYLQRQQAPSPERSPVPVGALNMGQQLFAAPGANPGYLVGQYDDPNNGSRINSNPANRRYSEMAATNMGGPAPFDSLANRAVRQVGRSANDINRIAERMRRQGDPRAIMQLGMLEKNQQFSTARDDQKFERRKQMFDMGQQAQTARDQVQRTYQTQDQQQAEIQRQSMEEARRQWELQMYGMKTGEQAMRDERDRVQAEQDRQRKIEHGLKPVPVEGTSTPYFHDANGSIYSGGQPAQPPPTFEMRRDATGAFRQFYGGKPIAGEPTYSGQVVPGSYVRRETQGQPAPVQYTPNLPQPTEKVTEGPTGTTRTYTQPRGATPAPAPAPATSPTGGPVNGAQPYTTPGGVQVELVPDQASVGTQMGQMPNEAYANPLTPEQSLEAARAEYLAGDKGAALQKHFQQFPSASTRLANQEAEIWQQVAGQVDAFGRGTADRGTARDRRDRWIERDTGGKAIIQGASADRYASRFPQSMKSIDQQLPPLDLSLIEQANKLNKIAQTRRAMNLR